MKTEKTLEDVKRERIMQRVKSFIKRRKELTLKDA